MLEVIYHISDIHIIQRNFINIRNSFLILVNTIRNDPRKSILVIAGDIFEHKNTLFTDEIQLFLEMIQMLEESQITTIVIPGNHDCNVNLNNTVDNVSLLNFRSKFVKVYSVTSRIDGLQTFGFDNVDFYVYSLIDKKSPQIVDNGRLRIAICHEQIQNAKYYNKMEVVNAKLTTEDFKDYHITLLGDIHNYQFLKPNIAYCGSFVQKNKGEDLNHGYILWDLRDCSGEFVGIPLKEIYLNVYAKNDNLYIPDYDPNIQTITYFCFKYSQCSKAFLDAAFEQLKKIAPLDKIICLDDIVSVESIQNTDDPITETQFKFSHDSIIKETLQKMNKEHLIDKILDYHHSKMSSIGESFLKNFVIQRLEWSNLYCYGEDNIVDFKDFLHDLVVINGKNKTGKSSFIDILVFILFNKNIRGKRNDIVNKNTKSGYAAVTLKQGNDEYILYRKKFRNSPTDEFTVKKNGQLITKATIDETYQFVCKEIGIGSFENFISFTTALQNRQFLLDSHKTGLVQLINSLLNIDFFDTIENDVKIEKSVLRKLGKEYTNKLEHYQDVNNDVLQLELKKQDESNCKIEEMKKERNSLLRQLKDLYKEYNKDIGIFQSIEEYTNTVIGDTIDDIENLKKENIQLTYKLEKLRVNNEIETTENISVLEELRKKSNYKDTTGFSEEAKDKLSEYKFYLLSHKEDAVVYLEQLEKCNGEYCELVESEEDIQNEIKGTKELMTIDKENVQKFLTFGTCQNCLDNSKFLSELDNQKLQERLEELFRKKDVLLNNKKCISNEEKKIRNAEKIKHKEKYSDIEKKVIAVNNYYFNKDLEDIEKKLRYLYTKKLQELDKKIQDYQLHRKVRNTEVWDSIKLLEEKLEDINKILDSTKEETKGDYHQLSLKYQEKLKLIEAIEENKNSYEFFDVYSQLIDKKTGIKSTILKSVCASLEKYVNYYLNIITDFQISIEWDKDIQIYTIDAGSEGKSLEKIPVDLASGFQKFILDIILRISLSKMFLNNNFLNLIIDEGFGNLDTENLTEFCKVLNKLRYQFRNIFIITHNEEVKSYGTKFLNVKVCKSGKSLIRNIDTSIRIDLEEPEIVDKYLEKRDNKWYCNKCKSSFLDSKSKLENHIKGKKHSQ